MKERPILFSAPMVRALLASSKTQTRRVMKNPPVWVDDQTPPGWNWEGKKPGEPNLFKWTDAGRIAQQLSARAVCPYGQPGDQLWVREAFADARPAALGRVLYRASGDTACRWKPGIHMPRDCSRLTLAVTHVRVERLQDISEADALAEGVPNSLNLPGGRFARENFEHLWWTINGDGAWELNPWVWVVEFRRVT